MKNPARTFAVLLAALGVTAAHAQVTSRSVQQTRSSLPAQQVATTPAAAAARPTTTVAQATPYAVAGKQVVPANLLSMEDRAIIIVGGKQVAAGDVKRQLVYELRQLSTPVTGARRRTPVTQPGTQVLDNPGSFGGGNFGIGRYAKQRKDSVNAAGATQTATRTGVGRTTIENAGQPYAIDRDYCLKHPAEITRVRGVVTPNGRFTIEGLCFGDQTGSVEAIGQFPGGNMRLVFERWTDSEIMAFVPAVSGAPDHAIALTVVRLDKTRSPAVQARFVATREIVVVPPRYWSPNSDFVHIDVDQGGGNIFTSYTVYGPHGSRTTPFTVAVNPACALDSAAWSTRAGAIEAFNGWENGPPNQANVDIIWTPRCTTETTNYIIGSSSQRICSIDFTLTAWASCPVGVAP